MTQTRYGAFWLEAETLVNDSKSNNLRVGLFVSILTTSEASCVQSVAFRFADCAQLAEWVVQRVGEAVGQHCALKIAVLQFIELTAIQRGRLTTLGIKLACLDHMLHQSSTFQEARSKIACSHGTAIYLNVCSPRRFAHSLAADLFLNGYTPSSARRSKASSTDLTSQNPLATGGDPLTSLCRICPSSSISEITFKVT